MLEQNAWQTSRWAQQTHSRLSQRLPRRDPPAGSVYYRYLVALTLGLDRMDSSRRALALLCRWNEQVVKHNYKTNRAMNMTGG